MKIEVLKLRLLKYTVKDTEYVVGTSILDNNLNVNQFADTYHSRWGIEEMYKTTKTMMNAEFIRSKNENGVLQEVYANFALQSLIRTIGNQVDSNLNSGIEALESYKKVKVKMNFSNILLTVQRHISGMFSHCKKTLKSTISTIFKNATRVYQAERPGRSFPRVSVRPVKRLRAD